MLAMGIASRGAHAQSFRVVVNTSVADRTLSRVQLSRLFLKQDSKYPSGQIAVPVDQIASSPVRESFSKDVIGRGVGPVKTYWQQQIFAGRSSPPSEKARDAEVIAYVATTPGAIGYVAATALLSDGVKLLSIAP
jgi:ABC-type phosphate transport system substrate-binding protein